MTPKKERKIKILNSTNSTKKQPFLNLTNLTKKQKFLGLWLKMGNYTNYTKKTLF